MSQLNSDVIRAFKRTYRIDENPNPSEVIDDEVDFYAHCSASIGVKLGYWEKVGKVKEVGPLDNILFRNTNDAGGKIGHLVEVSEKWYVWKINGEFRRVGKLEGENQKAEIGVVVTPGDVLQRMRTGKYNFVYPGF